MPSALLVAAVLLAGADSTVARLVREAETSSPAEFMRAIEVLEKLGPKRVPGLVRALKDKHPESSHWFACEALRRMPSVEAISALEARLDDERPLVRNGCREAFAAALVLGGRTPERMARVRAFLAHPESSPGVAAEIGPLEDPQVRAELVRLLDSNDDYALLAAVMGLRSATTDVEAIAARILSIAKDTSRSAFVREAAAGAMGDLRYRPARGYLLTLLLGPDPGGNIRTNAIDAIGVIGEERDVAVLETVIEADPFREVGGAWTRAATEAIARLKAAKGR